MPAKKYLGQHFLQNKKKLERMVSALGRDVSRVIEIGPGHGDLTRVLLNAGFVVWGIEKDHDMISIVQEKFSNEIANGKLKVIEGDALVEISRLRQGFHLRKRFGGQVGEQANFKFQISNKKEIKNYAVVGNIPYYITGKLFRVLEELKHKPTQTVLLVQKEVADRACAKVGDMNLLAASIGWWADARIITHVPRGMFNPPPKVDSAVIELKTKFPNLTRPGLVRLGKSYFDCIHALFKQPRKTIVRNLVDAGIARSNAGRAVQGLKLSLTARPQNLKIENIIKLSGLF